MAYCSNCGTKLPENAKFCFNCGNAGAIPKEEEPVKKKTIAKKQPKIKKEASQEAEPQIPTDTESEKSQNPPDSGGIGCTGCFRIMSWILAIIIGIVLLFTNPNEAKFKQYLYDTGSGTELIRHLFDPSVKINRNNYLLFSIYEAELNVLGVKVRGKYIGVFNYFIEIK